MVTASGRAIHRHVDSGGSFGANPLRQTIGLGREGGTVRVEVFWPRTGKTEVIDDVPVDRAIEIAEGREGFIERSRAPFALRRPAK